MKPVQWISALHGCMQTGQTAVLVTVCSVSGSAPRASGTKMVVTEAEARGTIGGGRLEFQALDQARKLLANPDVHTVIQDYPLGPLLGQCCGGHVRLLLETVVPEQAAWIPQALSYAKARQPFTLESWFLEAGTVKVVRLRTSYTGPALGFLSKDGRVLQGPRPAAQDCGGLWEAIEPSGADLLVFGAGHVGHALMHILCTLPFEVSWIDGRADRLETHYAGQIDTRCLDDPVSAVGDVPPDSYFLVMTHDHDLDYRLVRAILMRGDFVYCGLIGSRTKRARFENRLRKDGIEDGDLARLTCPIGAGGPWGKQPEVIAVAVAAELLRVLEKTGTVGRSLPEKEYTDGY